MVTTLSTFENYAFDTPIGLVVAESDRRAAPANTALSLAGCHARSSIDFAEAARDLSHFDGVALILVETAGAPEELLDPVLARIDTIARERGLPVIASVLPEQIDTAAAQLIAPRAQLLCEPSEAERLAAIVLAKFRDPVVLHDVTRDTESARLQRLNEEVARIADTLVRLTRGEDQKVRASATGYRAEGGGEPVEVTAQEVRAAIRARRLRGQMFDESLFGDPAWDMLLDLFAAHLEKRRVSVSSLCIAAAVPPTTALRWIGTMHETGLFERQADPSDRRRAYVALSPKGLGAMMDYAGAVKRAGLSLA